MQRCPLGMGHAAEWRAEGWQYGGVEKPLVGEWHLMELLELLRLSAPQVLKWPG
jgi:hypothetical protein